MPRRVEADRRVADSVLLAVGSALLAVRLNGPAPLNDRAVARVPAAVAAQVVMAVSDLPAVAALRDQVVAVAALRAQVAAVHRARAVEEASARVVAASDLAAGRSGRVTPAGVPVARTAVVRRVVVAVVRMPVQRVVQQHSSRVCRYAHVGRSSCRR